MSVRTIRANRRSITGWIPSRKNASGGCAFESALERDFATLLEFDATVASFESQPMRIHFEHPAGTARSYTPDFFVRYVDGRSIFAEVKYRKEIFENLTTYRPVFRAAFRYARDVGSRFKILTEVEIRTPFHRNVQFLLPFRRYVADSKMAESLMEVLRRNRESDPQSLIASVCSRESDRAAFTHALWTMIAHGAMHVDLTAPLSMRSRIRAVK